MDLHTGVSRRRLLGLSASVSISSVAGCNVSVSGGGDETAPTASPTGTRPPGDTATAHLEGDGATTITDISVSRGLTVIDARHDGEGDFAIEMVSHPGGRRVMFLDRTGPYTGRTARSLPAATHDLVISASGHWTATVSQPSVPTDGTAPSPPMTVEGSGNAVVGPYEFTGEHKATVTLQEAANHGVIVYPPVADGIVLGGAPPGTEVTAAESGYLWFQSTFELSAAGWIALFSKGAWTVEVA